MFLIILLIFFKEDAVGAYLIKQMRMYLIASIQGIYLPLIFVKVFNSFFTEQLSICFLLRDYNGYEISQKSSNSNTLYLKRTRPSGFPEDFDSIVIELIELNEFRAQVRVKPLDNPRWIPPVKLDLDARTCTDESKLYKFETDENFIKLIRKETNQVIWKLNFRNLIFSDQWLQAETHLPSLNLFGLGR